MMSKYALAIPTHATLSIFFILPMSSMLYTLRVLRDLASNTLYPLLHTLSAFSTILVVWTLKSSTLVIFSVLYSGKLVLVGLMIGAAAVASKLYC